MWQIYPQAFMFDPVAGGDTARNEAPLFFVLRSGIRTDSISHGPSLVGLASGISYVLAAGLSSDETHFSWSQLTGGVESGKFIAGTHFEMLKGWLLDVTVLAILNILNGNVKRHKKTTIIPSLGSNHMSRSFPDPTPSWAHHLHLQGVAQKQEALGAKSSLPKRWVLGCHFPTAWLINNNLQGQNPLDC